MATPRASEGRTQAADPLADPGIRRTLEEFVRRRVRSAEVDDVVQTVLCDALAAPSRPVDPSELRRWLLGIARNKVADLHRRSFRETAAELADLPVAPPPVEARELARWAEQQAAGMGRGSAAAGPSPSPRDAQQTLRWMAREGEGEKLEAIAAEERIPAARVRQRVSRMRRWMKDRWLAELAAVAALVVLAIVLARLLPRPEDAPVIAPRPEPQPTAPLREVLAPHSPLDRARALRAEAQRACGEAAWRRCLDALDEAARLDPAGDTAPEVTEARGRARRAIETQRAPTDPLPAPTTRTPAPQQRLDESAKVRAPVKVPPAPAPKDTKPLRSKKPVPSKGLIPEFAEKK